MGDMRWFTSDLHLGHTNVIRYCDRPFAAVGQMDAALIAVWNATVAPDDEVWVLGDVAMGRIEETLHKVGWLTGTKHLVLGNHDRPFDRESRRAQKWRGEYYRAGFAGLHHGEVSLQIQAGGERVAVRLCHFPYEGDSGERDRYSCHRPLDDGTWLLHGHVHEKWRQRSRMINVGGDAWAGRPVPETRIVELIAAGPQNLDRLEWAN